MSRIEMKTTFSKTAESKMDKISKLKTNQTVCPILCNVSGGQTPS